MRFLTAFMTTLMMTSAVGAVDWKEADLPGYADGVEYVAIGSDGLLYSLEANASGYVFRSLQNKYGFQVAGGGFGTVILSGPDVYYLGKSCDAANGNNTGSWTKDGTGLFFAVELKDRPRMTFRALDTDIEPGHSC